MNEGKLIFLDDYRPQVELTASQEARVRFGGEVLEALRKEAEVCRRIDETERAIEKHLIAMGFGDIVA